MPIDEHDRKTITEMIGEAVKAQTETVLEQVGARIDEAIKPVSEQVGKAVSAGDQLAAKIEQLQKQPEADDDHGKKDDDDPIAELRKTIGSLGDKLDGLAGEREAERKAERARELAEKVVAEQRPNLKKGRDEIVRRIAAASPADEESAAAALQTELESLKAIGVDVEKLGADPAGEGADPSKPGGNQFDEETRIEEVRAATGGRI